MADSDKPEAVVELLEEGPCQKRMRTEIPAESVTVELDESYEQLAKTIQLPGFRKGRVPRSVLERRYAEKVEEDVREDLMSGIFQKEVEKRELRVLGSPSFDNVEFGAGKPLRFDAVFEVAPTFELGDYKGIEIESRQVEVTEDEVGGELDSLPL